MTLGRLEHGRKSRIFVDGSGTIVEVNAAASAAYRVPASELVGTRAKYE
jgi:PAS domain-containing protein